jgi:hypothetical protein
VLVLLTQTLLQLLRLRRRELAPVQPSGHSNRALFVYAAACCHVEPGALCLTARLQQQDNTILTA